MPKKRKNLNSDELDGSDLPEYYKRQIRARLPADPGPAAKSPQKYGAKSVEGGMFPELASRRWDSQLEHAVAQDLCARLHAGEISDLQCQQTIYLTRARISWRIDFSYIEDGRLWYHEAKGFPTPAFKLQWKLYLVYGPAPIRLTEGSAHYRKTEEHFPTLYLEATNT